MDTISRNALRRWFSVGRSLEDDAATAGRAATRDALAGARPDAKLLIVFASNTYDLPVLLSAIAEVSGDAPMIGCTTAGEIATEGPAIDSVVVAAFGGAGFRVKTTRVVGAGTELRKAGHTAAGTVAAGSDPSANRVLMLLSDGMVRNQDEVVRGAYSAVGATIPLVGGGAGDDWRLKVTHQFHDGQVITDAVVAALLESDGPIGIGVRHGWTRVGEPMLVTAADGDRVYTLDDRPAVDAYLRLVDVPEEARKDGDAFAHFAATHPLGISRRSGEEVRVMGRADFSDGSIETWSHVPQGGMAWLMEGDVDSALQATVDACGDAMVDLAGQPAIGALAFDCMGRRSVLNEDGMAKEVATMATDIGAPVAGFYTYGEIARLKGPYGYHNQTLVMLAFG
jgi:hypothetical protein